MTDSTQYVDLSRTQLYGELKVQKKGGSGEWTDLDGDEVALINNIGGSIFKQVSVNVNNVSISEASDFYAYKAYIETVLSAPKEVKETHLRCRGFVNENPSAANSLNDGWRKWKLMDPKI